MLEVRDKAQCTTFSCVYGKGCHVCDDLEADSSGIPCAPFYPLTNRDSGRKDLPVALVAMITFNAFVFTEISPQWN